MTERWLEECLQQQRMLPTCNYRLSSLPGSQVCKLRGPSTSCQPSGSLDHPSSRVSAPCSCLYPASLAVSHFTCCTSLT